MSIEQANAFRKYVDENEALQQQVLEGLQDGSLKLTALAKEHGFEVTAEEAVGLVEQADPETDGELELTNFELSLVSGGMGRKAQQLCSAGKSAYDASNNRAMTKEVIGL